MDASESQAMPPRPRRRWRCRIASVFAVLMLVVGVSVTWSAARARAQREAVEALSELGDCAIRYDGEADNAGCPNSWFVLSQHGEPPLLPYPSWAETILDKDFVHRVIQVRVPAGRASKALFHLQQLPCLRTVYFLNRDGRPDHTMEAASRMLRQGLPGVEVIEMVNEDFDLHDKNAANTWPARPFAALARTARDAIGLVGESQAVQAMTAINTWRPGTIIYGSQDERQ